MKHRLSLGLIAALVVGAGMAAAPGAAQARGSAVARVPNLTALHMMTPTTGWATEASSILRTTNGGAVWTNVTPRGATLSMMSASQFIDARTAWVTATRQGSSAPILLHTTDGGRTWATLPLSLPTASAGVAQVTFIDARHGWLLLSLGAGAGSEGVQILQTSDGGQHWTTVSVTGGVGNSTPGSLPLGGIKSGITFRDASAGWATGFVPGPPGFAWLYRTLDGGRTWQHQSLPLPAGYGQSLIGVNPPRFFNPHDGIMQVTLNEGNLPPALDLYLTYDGGNSWTSTTPLPYRTTTSSLSWAAIDSCHGWAAWGAKVHDTPDGGRNWEAFQPNTSLQNVTALDFVSGRNGWALGMVSQGGATRSFLLQTADGGHTWSRLSPYVTPPANGGVQSDAATH